MDSNTLQLEAKILGPGNLSRLRLQKGDDPLTNGSEAQQTDCDCFHSKSSFLNLGEGLVKVIEQVIDVFNSHRNPNKVGGHSRGLELFGV